MFKFCYFSHRTYTKKAYLEKQNYNMLSIYTHELAKLNEEDALFASIFKRHKKERSTPLSVQDALIGGRVGYMRAYYKAAPDEQISMFDICSLVTLLRLCCCSHYQLFLIF